jgi:hypothetical protein
MTRHKATQTGLGTPSPLDRWINAMLRGLAMLVSFARSIRSMRLIRPPAECHSDATPEALPCEESGKLKEPEQAARSSQTQRASASSSHANEALMVSSERSSRPSNHEGGLTALSTSHPRVHPEDLGSRGGGTRPNSHDLPTEILGSSPRMTRGWVCGEQPTASAPN